MPSAIRMSGSRPSSGDISEINFSILYSLVQHRRIYVRHCWNCNVSGQNEWLSPEGRFQDRYTNAISIISSISDCFKTRNIESIIIL